MSMKALVFCLCLAMIFSVVGCSKPSSQVVELKRFPIDTMDGIITQSGVQFDKEISSDGKGSLRITATEPTVVRLFAVAFMPSAGTSC